MPDTDKRSPLPAEDRRYWVDILERLARVPLEAIAAGEVGARMPMRWKAGHTEGRANVTRLELLGRLLAGIAPWLENAEASAEEEPLRSEMATLTRTALAKALDPESPDRVQFSEGGQPLVDAAFLAHAILRAPRELWQKLDASTRERLIAGMKQTRRIRPPFNNWLLFAAMVEAFLQFAGEEWDSMRVDYAIRQHEQWHVGNGVYKDGPHFAWDYYNSYVIQPMLLDIAKQLYECDAERCKQTAGFLKRAQSYGAWLEQNISPEGTFPAVGRSITYRMGAFQLLAQLSLQETLPDRLPPAQVRCAMTAMMHRLMDALGTFTEDGWLQIGFAGYQPELGETYISTGSLYLCSTGLLPLGLGPENAFWSGPFTPWTSRRLYAGEDFARADLHA